MQRSLNSKGQIVGAWVFVLLICVILQAFMPIASDEAYFIAWGKTLLPGVYDHPPLPGWVSYPLRRLGDLIGLAQHGILHRVFVLVLGAFSLWLVARRIREMTGAAGSAILTLALIPGSLLMFNLYLNDTLLAFLSLRSIFISAPCSGPCGSGLIAGRVVDPPYPCFASLFLPHMPHPHHW